jgi:dinuclear metal center YbgI/SA1388 family protein
MDVDAFIRELEQIAPPGLAEPCDEGRIGLVIEGRGEVRTVCCALDATPSVVDEAIRSGADLLVVHHTPLWNPVTRIGGGLAPLLRSILRAEMGLYVMHTNFDRAPGGVNDTLASILSVTETEPLGPGLIGSCTLSPAGIVHRIGSSIRVWGQVDRIRRLALVGGSGFDPELLAQAAARGADAFLSAELKHAVFRTSPVPCIEATHYALENPAMKVLASRMGWRFIDDPPLITWYG